MPNKNNYEIVNSKDYKMIGTYFLSIPDVVKPMALDVKKANQSIIKALQVSPVFVKVVKSLIPNDMLVAVFTDEQAKQLADGAVELFTKKNGALMAKLRDPISKKIVSTIDLEHLSFTPELNGALINLSTQIQMSQIASKIDDLQEKVERVANGLETDRLATAYSLQQKFLQACSIKNQELKQDALLRVAMDAEDSRNLLMLSQRSNLKFILNQPESVAGKIFSNIKTKDNDNTIVLLRESMCALNMVSMVESLSYQALGEPDLSIQTMNYHSEFIEMTYGSKTVLKRLDDLDPEPTNYWSELLPSIQSQMKQLPQKRWEFLENIEEGEFND